MPRPTLTEFVTSATDSIRKLVQHSGQNNRPLTGITQRKDKGLYALSSPGKPVKLQTLTGIHTQSNLLMIQPQQAASLHITPQSIQWVSNVQAEDTGISSVTLHLEEEQQWHLLTLHLYRTEMLVLINWLKRHVAVHRIQSGQSPEKTPELIAARIVEEDWQGGIKAGGEVLLYLIPPLLVVLRGNTVQAKLATGSIRRVLAVERGGSTFDALWQRNSHEGLVRLHSLRETAAFLCNRHLYLAEEIASAAQCPLEVIERDDKRRKV
ncbi:MAG: hypothetical protein ACPG7F_18020 [Aggregatilineales bacterium]